MIHLIVSLRNPLNFWYLRKFLGIEIYGYGSFYICVIEFIWIIYRIRKSQYPKFSLDTKNWEDFWGKRSGGSCFDITFVMFWHNLTFFFSRKRQVPNLRNIFLEKKIKKHSNLYKSNFIGRTRSYAGVKSVSALPCARTPSWLHV